MPGKTIVQSGVPLLFTCENTRFKTDTSKGYEHLTGHNYKGSVTPEALYEDGDSLWLEHVVDKTNNNECFWFMWYDANGLPKVTMSGVFDKADLAEMISKLIEIKL